MKPDHAVPMTRGKVLCPRTESTESALDCIVCPYYRGWGGPPGVAYVRCSWEEVSDAR